MCVCVGISPVGSNEDSKVNSQRYLLQIELNSHTASAAVSRLAVNIKHKMQHLLLHPVLLHNNLSSKFATNYIKCSLFSAKQSLGFKTKIPEIQTN